MPTQNGILVTDMDATGRTLFDDYTIEGGDWDPGFPFDNVRKVNGGEIWTKTVPRISIGGYQSAQASINGGPFTSDTLILGPFKNLFPSVRLELFQYTGLGTSIYNAFFNPRLNGTRVAMHTLPSLQFQSYLLQYAVGDEEGPIDPDEVYEDQQFKMRCAWMFMGRKIEPSFNFEYGSGFKYIDDSVVEYSEDGVRFVEPGFVRKTWRGTWNDLTQDDAEALAFVQENSARQRMVYWNPYPDSAHPFDVRQAGVYHIEDFGEIKHSSEGTYSTEVFLVEAPTLVNTQD